MAEISYSKELKRPISATEAHDLSINGELTSKYSFRCIDEKCKAPLTLSNFGVSRSEGAERVTFSVSKQEQKHIHNCDVKLRQLDILQEHSTEDYREEAEIRQAQNLGEVIEFLSEDLSNTRSAGVISDIDVNLRKSEQNSNGEISKDYKGRNRRFSSLRSLVYIFQVTEKKQKQRKLIRVGQNKYSMNEFFVNVDKLEVLVPDEDYRVYFGGAKIHSTDKKI